MRNQGLRKWEIALMVGLAVALLTGGWAESQQSKLASQVVRLHVVANSDTQIDQGLKLAVRDAILAQSESLWPQSSTVSDAKTAIEANLSQLQATGQRVVATAGFDYKVTATLADDVWFPTKIYDDFSLPAGRYTALRITIGSGAGQNWWCVVFPPLCLGSVTAETATTLEAQDWDTAQVALVTGQTEEYILKFKTIELWNQWKEWVTGHKSPATP